MNDKYLTYGLNDFLEDPAFIREVRSGNPNRSEWEKWLSVNPSKEAIYNEATQIIHQMQFKKHELSTDRVEKIWKTIDRNTLQLNQRSGYRLIRYLAYTGVAALLAWVIYFVAGITQQTILTTVRTEHISYNLPDASSVELNSSSTIRFDKKKWNDERYVFLTGEAFFEVIKGNPFVVGSPNGRVEVLGTSFNVYSRDSVFEVKCRTGSVKVISSNLKDTAFLSPGEAVLYGGLFDSKLAYNLDADKINAWVEGVFEYTATPLKTIFSEMERQFDIEFVLDANLNIEPMRYTGTFRNDDPGKAIHDVCWPMHLDYVISGKQVNVSFRK